MRPDRTDTRPKMTLLMWLVGFLCMVEFTGCSAKTGRDVVNKYNQAPLTVNIPSNLSPKQVEEAMVGTLIRRGWQIEQQSPQEVVGTLNRRSYQAKVVLKVDNSVIKILSESSYKSKPAVPEGWLQNLQEDLNKNLGKIVLNAFPQHKR